MNKKTTKVILLIAIPLIVVAITIISISLFSAKKQIDLTFNSIMPIDKIVNYDNQPYELKRNRDTVVFYLSDSCSVCLDELQLIKTVYDCLSDNVEVMILWDNNIPNDRVEKTGLNKFLSYSIQGKFKINTGLTPQSFIFDSKGKIIFSNESADVTKTVNKLIKEYATEGSSLEFLESFSKDKLLLFFCNEYEDIDDYNISDKIDINVEDFKIIKIVNANIGVEENLINDEHSFIKKIFKIDKTPCVVLYEFGKSPNYINFN